MVRLQLGLTKSSLNVDSWLYETWHPLFEKTGFKAKENPENASQGAGDAYFPMEIIAKCSLHGQGNGSVIDCNRHFHPVLTDSGILQ